MNDVIFVEGVHSETGLHKVDKGFPLAHPLLPVDVLEEGAVAGVLQDEIDVPTVLEALLEGKYVLVAEGLLDEYLPLQQNSHGVVLLEDVFVHDFDCHLLIRQQLPSVDHSTERTLPQEFIEVDFVVI